MSRKFVLVRWLFWLLWVLRYYVLEKLFIASLLCLEGKKSIKSQAGVIQRCKENKITAPPNAWCNIQKTLPY